MRVLIWLIGKPGSGKTTVGKDLQNKIFNSLHFSFGELLKEIQKNPILGGYTLDERQKVRDFLREKSREVGVLIIDANPYPPTDFSRRKQIDELFDKVFNINFICDDEIALERLELRGRKLLGHEGKDSIDRITNFNNILLPEIEKLKKVYKVLDIKTSYASVEEVSSHIINHVVLKQ